MDGPNILPCSQCGSAAAVKNVHLEYKRHDWPSGAAYKLSGMTVTVDCASCGIHDQAVSSWPPQSPTNS